MKISFNRSVCKAITTFACASFVFAGMLGLGSLSAKAATRSYSLDYSNGKSVTLNSRNISLNDAPKDKATEDALATTLVAALFDPDFSREKSNNAMYTGILSTNPYQGIRVNTDECSVVIKAMEGSVGTGKYIITKELVDKKFQDLFDRKEVYTALAYFDACFDYKNTDEYLYISKKEAESRIIGNEYVIEIKYSDLPVTVSKTVDAGDVTSFKVGTEIEDNGIKYRILDAAGNLSAIGLTTDAKTVTIPNAISFSGLNLNVTDIAQGFMKGNKKAKKVTIGSNVTSIGKEAFYKSKKLKKVTVKSTKITSIGKKAFGKNSKNFMLKMPKSCKKTYKKLLKKAKIKL